MTRPRLTATIISGLALVGSIACAGSLQEFYSAKAQAATPEAFARVSTKLAEVEVGMTQGRLFELLEMKVLKYQGQSVDVLLDGYLLQASLAANQEEPGRTHMVFGYADGENVHPRLMISLEGERVVALSVREVAPAPMLIADAGLAPR